MKYLQPILENDEVNDSVFQGMELLERLVSPKTIYSPTVESAREIYHQLDEVQKNLEEVLLGEGKLCQQMKDLHRKKKRLEWSKYLIWNSAGRKELAEKVESVKDQEEQVSFCKNNVRNLRFLVDYSKNNMKALAHSLYLNAESKNQDEFFEQNEQIEDIITESKQRLHYNKEHDRRIKENQAKLFPEEGADYKLIMPEIIKLLKNEYKLYQLDPRNYSYHKRIDIIVKGDQLIKEYKCCKDVLAL